MCSNFAWTTHPFHTPADLSEFFPDNQGQKLIAYSYGGVRHNSAARTQPTVEVAFSNWDDDSPPHGDTKIDIPLTALEHVHLGSIWKNGLAQELLELREERFDVDFSENRFDFAFPKDCLPSPRGTYDQWPLNLIFFQKCWVTRFLAKKNLKVLIPSIEVFSRLYGYSQEINRVLATYDKKEVQNRLQLPVPEPEEEGIWKVRVNRRFARNDALHIAHYKYDSYTRECFHSIYAQLENQYKKPARNSQSTRPPPIQLQVPPWFRGKAEIKVRGFWVDSETFLALNILGCSEPNGPPIFRYEYTAADDPEVPQDDFSSYYVYTKTDPPAESFAPLTKNQQPGHFTKTIVLPGKIETLGRRRHHEKRDYPGNPGTGKGPHPQGTNNPNNFGGGDPYGSTKSTGQEFSLAEPILESKGDLRDFWDALLEFKRTDPSIQRVEWFTYQDGFQETPEPNLIPLTRTPGKTQTERAANNWIFKKEPGIGKPTHRGVLAVRALINGKALYFLEIQRKLIEPNTDKKGEPRTPYPEAFQGLVFSIADTEEAISWIENVLEKIPYKRGVMDKIAPNCPGDAATYKHPRPKDDGEAHGQRAVKNALRKIK